MVNEVSLLNNNSMIRTYIEVSKTRFEKYISNVPVDTIDVIKYHLANDQNSVQNRIKIKNILFIFISSLIMIFLFNIKKVFSNESIANE